MSAGKFASMTAGLLARKGDAQPSAITEPPGNAKTFAGWTSFKTLVPPPSLQRAAERVDALASVPPKDMRGAEGASHVRREDFSGSDLRLVPREVVVDVAEERALKSRVKKLPEPDHIEKTRRMFVNVTPEEYERLGIIAVKRDTSRHQLVRDALDAFLEAASKDYGGCACVGSGCKGACQD
ncbi:MAG TPA: hypothetical protein VHL34_04215 [Rhizomicrobium sp.]|jgi:hypothetical protein|nr:hypothetical protein [Rhizomicrobium sp.]